jgi:hypothetical protein
LGNRLSAGRVLLDQLELQFEELETSAAEDEVAASPAAPEPTAMHGLNRHKPVRGPLPAHLPRERVVVQDKLAPAAVSASDKAASRLSTLARTAGQPTLTSV